MGFSQFHVMQSKCQLVEEYLPEKPRETITPLETEGVLQKEERTLATVYVLSRSGKPLMPTTRCGHVRILLKEKKARVVERCPFTIQLTYETEEQTQPLILGIDPGRTNIGASTVTEEGEIVFIAQLVTRNKDVPKLMKERKQFRMTHRRLKRRNKRQRRAKAAGTTSPKEAIERVLPGCEEPIHCKGIRTRKPGSITGCAQQDGSHPRRTTCC